MFSILYTKQYGARMRTGRSCSTTVTYYPNGSIKGEEWRKNGKKHKFSSPAETRYNYDRSKCDECWFLNGKKNRLNGPAEISYYEDGLKYGESWFLNGELTRSNIVKTD